MLATIGLAPESCCYQYSAQVFVAFRQHASLPGAFCILCCVVLGLAFCELRINCICKLTPTCNPQRHSRFVDGTAVFVTCRRVVAIGLCSTCLSMPQAALALLAIVCGSQHSMHAAAAPLGCWCMTRKRCELASWVVFNDKQESWRANGCHLGAAIQVT
jgi:hypothetical protein